MEPLRLYQLWRRVKAAGPRGLLRLAESGAKHALRTVCTQPSDWREVLWREWLHVREREQTRRLFPVIEGRISRHVAGWFGALAGAVAGLVCFLPIVLLLPLGVAATIAAVVGSLVYCFAQTEALGWFTSEAPEPWMRDLKRSLSPLCRYYGEGIPIRPSLSQVEGALRAACRDHEEMRQLWQPALDQLTDQCLDPPAVEVLLQHLRDTAWPDRFLAPYLLAARGGEAVPRLVASHDFVARRALQDSVRVLQLISEDTMGRLRDRVDRLVCTSCLTRFAVRRLKDATAQSPPVATGRLVRAGLQVCRAATWAPLVTTRYCGCRNCGQSRDFLDVERGIVAVLDRDMEPEHELVAGELRVNALRRDAPFDFDRVEIHSATDHDIERFCIVVGNDTDDHRRKRRGGVPCSVSAACRLDQNTRRVLGETFGEVRYADRSGACLRSGVATSSASTADVHAHSQPALHAATGRRRSATTGSSLRS